MMTLILGGLVTWRLSRMIVKETGPLSVFSRIRAYFAQKQKRIGGIYDMISCTSCTSVWVGAVAALWPAESVLSWITYTLAFSAVSLLIERLYTHNQKEEPRWVIS